MSAADEGRPVTQWVARVRYLPKKSVPASIGWMELEGPAEAQAREQMAAYLAEHDDVAEARLYSSLTMGTIQRVTTVSWGNG